MAVKEWCQTELSKLLQTQIEMDTIDYIFSMESHAMVEDYLLELLGKEDTAAKQFIDTLLQKWKPQSNVSFNVDPLMEVYHRPSDDEMILMNATKKPSGKHKKQEGSAPRQPQAEKRNVMVSDVTSSGKNQATALQAATSLDRMASAANSSRKTKSKFVSLSSAEGASQMTVQLPGRYSCECHAQRHALINNCTECGRIVCAQEGSGPCLFCGSLVLTPAEQQSIAGGSKGAQKRKEKLLKQYEVTNVNAQLEIDDPSRLLQAQQHKDKLLNYDQTSSHRTKVIDDESDYFSVDANRWLSATERDALSRKEAELLEAKYRSRRDRKVVLDFAGRRVIEEEDHIDMYDGQHVTMGSPDKKHINSTTTTTDGISNPNIPVKPPQFIATQVHSFPGNSTSPNSINATIVRLQDNALQQMKDEGKCLSMHQPWASLLVMGIKKHEGRVWYTPHRGRLWIAATRKEASREDINTLEQLYKSLYAGREITFPTEYPTSCLLGSVEVLDCLSQDEYRVQHPNGESDSPYVLLTDNQLHLTVRLRVSGKHKLWKLPADIHGAAKRQLQVSNNNIVS
ncbi:activating signal cointegrator 1-like isoform X2 [Dysidea avara]|uniref:activating signal cointegrator 1-like isoform X2 n=1 Tax=Dysidea avara TaxID=196820 RepID=UPI00331C15C7